MTGKELLKLLSNLTEEQLELDINLVNSNSEDTENIWLQELEVSNTGSSGYEVAGEIRLIGNE